MRTCDLHGAPAYLVERDGKYLVERDALVGWHWMRPANAWTRDPKRASKFTRTLARLAAFEHGGQVVRIA